MLRDYTPDEYWKLTSAEKQKLWQLRNTRKTPGIGPTRQDRDFIQIQEELHDKFQMQHTHVVTAIGGRRGRVVEDE